MELSEKAGVVGRPRASADYNYSEKRQNEQKSWRKLDTDHQRGQYYKQGEAAMSAPPFFQSAGRGDLLFWGKQEGPTVIIWESLAEQKKKSWLE